MILYHYCSNETFKSIIEGRSIWLSSLSLSNDSMEGKWLRNVFTKVCAEGKLDEHSQKQVIEQFAMFEDLLDGLGLCLSEHGDMLSQWRGYASDGAGVCIGFSKKYFEELFDPSADREKPWVSLVQIEYDLEEQKKIILPTYNKVKKFIEEGAFKFVGRRVLLDSRTDEEIAADRKKQENAFYGLAASMRELVFSLYKLKNPAFREETEWRLISYLTKSERDECEIRSSLDRIIPYRVFEIPENEDGPILKVILGPKNITPVSIVDALLKQRGYKRAEVVRSAASYR